MEKILELMVKFLADQLAIDPTKNRDLLIFFPPLAAMLLSHIGTLMKALERRWRLVRRFRRDEESLTGEWLQIVLKGGRTFCTTVVFRFNAKVNLYELRGISYDDVGAEYAKFIGRSVSFVPGSEEIVEFVYTSELATGRKSSGFGAYEFSRIASKSDMFGWKKYDDSGRGSIVDFELDRDHLAQRTPDSDPPSVRLILKLQRVTKSMKKKILGKNAPLTQEDFYRIARSLLDSSSESIAATPANGGTNVH